MAKERWSIIESANRYSVSTLGRVINNTSGRIMKSSAKVEKGRIRYERVKLKVGRRQIHFKVHSLMKVFLGPPPTKAHTSMDHKNRNPLDNKLSNLRWATPRDQARNRSINNTKQVKISYIDLSRIYDMTRHMTLKEIGDEFNITKTVVFTLLKYMHPEY